jgi:hypothetical protein
METNQLLSDLKTAISNARTILVVTHAEHTHDSIGSTLALYLGLTGLGKTVTVVTTEPLHVDVSDYIGADKVRSTIGKKNFVISLPYKDGSIEKVSYNIEDDQFHLVIEPREGFEFSKDTVTYGTQGGVPDCIIAVDTIHLGKLGTLYEENRDLFGGVSNLINIDTHENNTMYGTINTVELVAVALSTLGVQLSTDIATNILNAIYETTKNFTTQNVNGRTFEIASVCMKASGVRFVQSKGQEVIIGKHEGKSVHTEQKKIDDSDSVESKPTEKIAPTKDISHGDPAMTDRSQRSDQGGSHSSIKPEEWLKPDMSAGSDQH